MAHRPKKSELGQQHVGLPILEVRSALDQLAATKDFAQVRFEALECYFDLVFFRLLPEQLDEALSARALQALSPEVVQVACVLLLRDLLQRHPVALLKRPSRGPWKGKWVEGFTLKLLELTGAPVEPYVEWVSRVDSKEEDTALLVAGLAHQLGLDPAILLGLHLGVCEVVAGELAQEAKR